MSTTLQVSTRQLLRNFKDYKELLLNGKVESFEVPVDHGREITVALKKKNSTGKEIAEQFMKLKKPIQFKRWDIFKGFLAPR